MSTNDRHTSFQHRGTNDDGKDLQDSMGPGLCLLLNFLIILSYLVILDLIVEGSTVKHSSLTQRGKKFAVQVQELQESSRYTIILNRSRTRGMASKRTE